MATGGWQLWVMGLLMLPVVAVRGAGVDFKKGPYYANVGDFASAGAFNVRYYDQLPVGLTIAEGGQVGYGRTLAANNAELAGGNLLYAGRYEHNNGPWNLGDNEEKPRELRLVVTARW